MILRTAQLTVVVQNLDKARAGMDQVVKRYSGYVGDLTISRRPAMAARKLTANLRLPAAQLDAAIAELKTLGRVESESQSGQDVTAQYVDLEARLSNARKTEQRLIDLLQQRTGKLSDVLEVETELSRVREEIERMEGERRLLSKQVEYATLSATICRGVQGPGASAARFVGHPLPERCGRRLSECGEFRTRCGAVSCLGRSHAAALDCDSVLPGEVCVARGFAIATCRRHSKWQILFKRVLQAKATAIGCRSLGFRVR